MNTNHPSNPTSITPNRKVGHLAVNQSSTNERCPVCDRSFGPKAFDRHVEFCKEQRNRVQVHKSPAVVQQAKERLDARINYRVPPLRQVRICRLTWWDRCSEFSFFCSRSEIWFVISILLRVKPVFYTGQILSFLVKVLLRWLRQ